MITGSSCVSIRSNRSKNSPCAVAMWHACSCALHFSGAGRRFRFATGTSRISGISSAGPRSSAMISASVSCVAIVTSPRLWAASAGTRPRVHSPGSMPICIAPPVAASAGRASRSRRSPACASSSSLLAALAARRACRRASHPVPPARAAADHHAITAADLETRLYILSDDSMAGRQAGTDGNIRATAYIADEAKRLGLQPAGDSGTYFQYIPLVRRSYAAAEHADASAPRGSPRLPTGFPSAGAAPRAPSTACASSSAVSSPIPPPGSPPRRPTDASSCS